MDPRGSKGRVGLGDEAGRLLLASEHDVGAEGPTVLGEEDLAAGLTRQRALQRWLNESEDSEPLFRLRCAVDERTFRVLRYALTRR